MVKFIPKWHHIQVGDKVFTSGLDNIFFAGIPTGIVTKVEIQSSYTVAYIKTYSDIFHPKTFFLITDARETLTEGLDSNKTQIHHTPPSETINQHNNNDSADVSITVFDINQSEPIVSSIPARIDQTQEIVIEPETVEEQPPVIQKPKRKPIKRKRRTTTLDLF